MCKIYPRVKKRSIIPILYTTKEILLHTKLFLISFKVGISIYSVYMSIYSQPYIPILLTACNNISVKNVTKRINSIKLLNCWVINQLNVVNQLFFSACKNDQLKLTSNCFFVIQSGKYQFQLINHLVAHFTIFSAELKKHKHISCEIKLIRLRSQIYFFHLSSFFSNKIAF